MDTLHLPGEGHRLLNRLVSERDGTLVAARLLLFTGQLPRSDAHDFIPALRGAFDRLDAEQGAFATPAIATWVGLQSPGSFDAVVIPPEDNRNPDVAFVALHGFTGNFAVYCWQLSRAARAISALTVCPSVGPRGDWWSPRASRPWSTPSSGSRGVASSGCTSRASPMEVSAPACSPSASPARGSSSEDLCSSPAPLRAPIPQECPCCSSRASATR